MNVEEHKRTDGWMAYPKAYCIRRGFFDRADKIKYKTTNRLLVDVAAVQTCTSLTAVIVCSAPSQLLLLLK